MDKKTALELIKTLQEILVGCSINHLIGWGLDSEDREREYDIETQASLMEYWCNWAYSEDPLEIEDIYGGVILVIYEDKMDFWTNPERTTSELKAAVMQFQFYQGEVEKEFKINSNIISGLLSSTVKCENQLAHSYIDFPEAAGIRINAHGDLEILNQDNYFPEIIANVEKANYLLAEGKGLLSEIAGEKTDEIETQPNPIRWKGGPSDLVDLFVALRKKGYIEASQSDSEFEIRKLLVMHFASRDGQEFKMSNLKTLLDQRKNSADRFSCIPDPAPPKNKRGNNR